MRIAVPITATTLDEALVDMTAAAPKENILEVRIDYIRRIAFDALVEILDHAKHDLGNIPLIITNRHPDERGKFEGSEEERVMLLKQAATLGASYVDMELRYFQKLPDKGSIIVSYHDF